MRRLRAEINSSHLHLPKPCAAADGLPVYLNLKEKQVKKVPDLKDLEICSLRLFLYRKAAPTGVILINRIIKS